MSHSQRLKRLASTFHRLFGLTPVAFTRLLAEGRVADEHAGEPWGRRLQPGEVAEGGQLKSLASRRVGVAPQRIAFLSTA